MKSLGAPLNVDTINERGLAWDNRGEFPSLDCPEIDEELERLAGLIEQAASLGEELHTKPETAVALALAELEHAIIGPLEGLLYLAYIEIAVDSTCEAAHHLANRVEALRARRPP